MSRTKTLYFLGACQGCAPAHTEGKPREDQHWVLKNLPGRTERNRRGEEGIHETVAVQQVLPGAVQAAGRSRVKCVEGAPAEKEKEGNERLPSLLEYQRKLEVV